MRAEAISLIDGILSEELTYTEDDEMDQIFNSFLH